MLEGIDIIHMALALAAFGGIGLYYLERRKTQRYERLLLDMGVLQ